MARRPGHRRRKVARNRYNATARTPLLTGAGRFAAVRSQRQSSSIDSPAPSHPQCRTRQAQGQGRQHPKHLRASTPVSGNSDGLSTIPLSRRHGRVPRLSTEQGSVVAPADRRDRTLRRQRHDAVVHGQEDRARLLVGFIDRERRRDRTWWFHVPLPSPVDHTCNRTLGLAPGPMAINVLTTVRRAGQAHPTGIEHERPATWSPHTDWKDARQPIRPAPAGWETERRRQQSGHRSPREAWCWSPSVR